MSCRSTLKAISAPYGKVRFIPTGGISTKNLCDYLSLPSVMACGGSWIAPRDLLAAGDFEAIGKRTAEAVKIISNAQSA